MAQRTITITIDDEALAPPLSFTFERLFLAVEAVVDAATIPGKHAHVRTDDMDLASYAGWLRSLTEIAESAAASAPLLAV